MTRTGITIVLVGLLIAGLGAAAFLLPFVVPLADLALVELFFRGVQISWGIGALLVLVGAVVALIGRLSGRRASP